jgi:hypothetical protein
MYNGLNVAHMTTLKEYSSILHLQFLIGNQILGGRLRSLLEKRLDVQQLEQLKVLQTCAATAWVLVSNLDAVPFNQTKTCIL